MNELMKIKNTLEITNQEYLGNLGYVNEAYETNDLLELELKGEE